MSNYYSQTTLLRVGIGFPPKGMDVLTVSHPGEGWILGQEMRIWEAVLRMKSGKTFFSLCIQKSVWSRLWGRKLPEAVPIIGIQPSQVTVEADQEKGSKVQWYSNIPKSTGFAKGYHLDPTDLRCTCGMTQIRKRCDIVPDFHLIVMQQSLSEVSYGA